MEAAAGAPARTRLIPTRALVADTVALLTVTAAGLVVRLVTAGLFSSGISTDEYRYAIIAQEWLRVLARESPLTLQTLVVHHPLVAVSAGLVSAASGLDPLLAGRALQLMLNTATPAALYLLARTAGLRTAAAATGAAGLAVMPGFWDASAAFLPDSQLAMESTLVLLGAVLGLRGHPLGNALAGAAAGFGLLTKEHLPLVLLPSLAVLCAVGLWWHAFGPGRVARLAVCVAVGLGLALLVGSLGLGIPRAIVFSVVSGTQAAVAAVDGLPPAAPYLESEAGTSWVTSLLSTIMNADLSLGWFGDAFGLPVLSSAVVVIGLVGACQLLAAARAPINGRSERTAWSIVNVLCSATPIVLFAAQILVRGDSGALMVAATLTLAFALLSSGRLKLRAVDQDWPRSGADPLQRALFWAVVGGLSASIATTLAFFALRLEQVSFVSRMFLPIMPACAFFFGIGCVGVGRMLRPLTEGRPVGLLVAVGGVLIGLLLPGGPIRKVGVVLVACLLGVGLHWSRLGRPLPHTQTLAVLTGVLALVIGTPTFNTLSRAREFRGFPDDAYYRTVSGGIRVTTFRAAEPWLQGNVHPTETVITSKPYQVSWHGAMGYSGFQLMRVWDERAADRRRYLRDDVLQSGAYDWIIDFNQFAPQADSAEGPSFAEDYRWLQARPYLREAYTATDTQGRILLYAFRHIGGQ